MLLNVAAHKVSIRNVKVSKRECYIMYSVTKHTACTAHYVIITKRFVTVYILWHCTLFDIYVLKTLRFGTLTLCAATFCNITSCDVYVMLLYVMQQHRRKLQGVYRTAPKDRSCLTRIVQWDRNRTKDSKPQTQFGSGYNSLLPKQSSNIWTFLCIILFGFILLLYLRSLEVQPTLKYLLKQRRGICIWINS